MGLTVIPISFTWRWLSVIRKSAKSVIRKSAKIVIRAFHQRRNEIKENIMVSLLQKQKDREEKEKRVVERKKAIIQEVQDLNGEWESKEKVDRELDMINCTIEISEIFPWS